MHQLILVINTFIYQTQILTAIRTNIKPLIHRSTNPSKCVCHPQSIILHIYLSIPNQSQSIHVSIYQDQIHQCILGFEN